MNVIAVPSDNDPVLNQERARLSPWASTHGWVYFDYNGTIDFYNKLSASASSHPGNIGIIEISAHGNPSICNGIDNFAAQMIGPALSRIPGFSGQTQIYLSGCNTGLNGNPCIAQILANYTGCTVFGTRGYESGTRCDSTDAVSASSTGPGGVYYPPYPGGVNANGPTCWNAFHKVGLVLEKKAVNMNVVSIRWNQLNIDLPLADSEKIIGLINETTSEKSPEKLELKIAPEILLTIQKEDGEEKYEILSRGAVLRKCSTNEVWQFKHSDEIMSSWKNNFSFYL